MKKLNHLLIFGAMAACVAGFTSCNDDDEYDFPGTTDNFVFHLDKSASFKVVKTPLFVVSTIDVEIPVQCTRKADGEITTTFDIDNSLIDEYNEANGTNYIAAPEGLIVLDNKSIVIPKGAMKSTDAVKVRMTDDENIRSLVTDENPYLVPIRRTSVEGNKAYSSVDVNPVVYLTLNVTEDNVFHGATASDAKGTLVADQSGWSGTYNGNPSDDFQKMFDGNALNYATFSNSGEISLVVDMGKEYTFDAITMYYTQQGYWSTNTYGCFAANRELSTSSDGTNWRSTGTFETGDSNLIKVFYAPITARYIRIVAPASYWRQSIVCGIFNVYAL